jgi:hypothetical protein
MAVDRWFTKAIRRTRRAENSLLNSSVYHTDVDANHFLIDCKCEQYFSVLVSSRDCFIREELSRHGFFFFSCSLVVTSSTTHMQRDDDKNVNICMNGELIGDWMHSWRQYANERIILSSLSPCQSSVLTLLNNSFEVLRKTEVFDILFLVLSRCLICMFNLFNLLFKWVDGISVVARQICSASS